uniref:DNA repair protein RadC n=1 Tax=Candidatus Kentrum sp. MB TaxID=2138164 RepID=A0A450XAG9_9GAMM|nr:MAG: DNA repair protein RadC [Candidatus Kentron sp. MB]VFK35624.1 MAG: DNA repair protein RadC [Candidatus Kentron sp. MB]
MEILRVSVLKNAVSVILVHNHPAENVTPSDADKDLTDRRILGRILHIPVFGCFRYHNLGWSMTYYSIALYLAPDGMLDFVYPFIVGVCR